MEEPKEKLEEAGANWYITLDVECPLCNHINDLMQVDEWWCIFGDVGESRENVDYEHQCSGCGKPFLITDSNH